MKHHLKPRILFVLKHREATWGENDCYSQKGVGLSSGLLNSATFMADMLAQKHPTKLVQVIDNNQIDKEVTDFKPTHVIIEAYWVVPEKFDVLKKLHPHVEWIVRNHSNMSFLSMEGIAMEWSLEYLKKGIILGVNSPLAFNDFKQLAKSRGISEDLVIYMPNYYPINMNSVHNRKGKGKVVDVACFGAIRPLKNQLNQAIAAINFANKQGVILNFHMNGSRIEGGGGQILKNIRALFAESKHNLIEHKWLEHKEFLDLMRTMDLSLQVSFSETFNIVTADAINCGIPVVVSKEIPYLSEDFTANPNDIENITRKLSETYNHKFANIFIRKQKKLLLEYCEQTKHIWFRLFKV